MRPALAVLAFTLGALTAAGETLTVDQAVAIALENNANVRNARLEVEKSQTRVAAARTQRLPSLTLNAIGGEALTNLSFEIDNGPANRPTRVDLARTFNMLAVARITQPITQQHAIGLGIRLNEAALAVEREHERAARQTIAREVRSAWFAAVAAQNYATALREAVTAWEEVDREMNVRVAQKVVLEADRLDAAARLAATRLAALSAENNAATASERLTYLVGRDVEVAPGGTFEPLPIPPGDPALRPDLREAELRVEQARLSVDLKNAERIPEVALVVSNTTPLNNDVLPANMTSAGIAMSYEPFTWGRRKAEIAERRHALDQAENALRDKRAAAAVEVAALRRKVEEAQAQISVRRMEVEAARERLRVTSAKFNHEAARPDEMSNAGASLTQAAAREQEAVSAYWTARADYAKAIGEE
jgi:outer membrane protein TolC